MLPYSLTVYFLFTKILLGGGVNLKTEQLEQLLKVLECGSISKAARKLYISQPSLTKNIAQLESEYGIKILTRTSKGIELTEEGINFVFYAKQILTATNGLNNAFRNNHADCSRLFLASQEFDFLADILHELYVENTDNHVHYNILEVDRGEVILRVLNRRSDIGLIVSYGEHEKKQMWMRDAGSFRYVSPCRRRSHRLCRSELRLL